MGINLSFDSTATEGLVAWMKTALADIVQDVIVSKRLVDAPAMIVNPTGTKL